MVENLLIPASMSSQVYKFPQRAYFVCMLASVMLELENLKFGDSGPSNGVVGNAFSLTHALFLALTCIVNPFML